MIASIGMGMLVIAVVFLLAGLLYMMVDLALSLWRYDRDPSMIVVLAGLLWMGAGICLVVWGR